MVDGALGTLDLTLSKRGVTGCAPRVFLFEEGTSSGELSDFLKFQKNNLKTSDILTKCVKRTKLFPV